MIRRTAAALTTLIALSVPATAFAEWSVVSEASSLGFISVKNGDIPESHSFGELTGTVSEDGAAEIKIGLASVETGIDIRNERMRDMLFNVADNPFMTVRADIGLDRFTELQAGDRIQIETIVTLDTGSTERSYAAPLNVTRLGADRVAVSSAKPIAVDVSRLGYTDGIEALRNVAGLDAISLIVPVSFDLVLER